MKCPTKIVLFFLLFADVVLNIDFGPLRPVSRNKLSLEKYICKRHPGSKIDKKFKCLVKYIDRNHLKIDLQANLTAPISSIKLRQKYYYKYSTYQQMGRAFSLDVCDALYLKKMIPPVQWCFELVSKYSNINHTCPYSGYLFAKADNVSVDDFTYSELLPAGRYHIDTTFFEDDDRILFNTSLYFSVSDHRLDVSYSKV